MSSSDFVASSGIPLSAARGQRANHQREAPRPQDGRGLFAGRTVEILEITKLRDDMGEKTIAIEAFEGNNLVMVDEGHRGASGGGDGA